jgi:hypothetical protein
MIAFRCYSRPGSDGEAFDAWRAALPAEFNATVDAELELIARDRSLTESGRLKELRGKCAGLTEIIIDFELDPDQVRKKPETVHLRILGFGTVNDFVLLYGFRKRGGPDYGPACHAALNRKHGVERDGRRARPCRFP